MDDLLQMTSNNYSWIQAQELVAKGHTLVIQNVGKFVLPPATDCCRFFGMYLTNLNSEPCIRKGYVLALFLFAFVRLVFFQYKIILFREFFFSFSRC